MTEKSSTNDGLCILSFDSGGPGVYSQLLIVKEYMNRISADLGVGEDDIYPADYFDLMGGVGFGGLVAMLLARFRMNVDQAIDALLTIASTVFPEEPAGSQNPAANTQNLRLSIEDMLESLDVPIDTKMYDAQRLVGTCKVVLYAAASINLAHIRAFRTYSVRGSSLNPTIVDAICATMSIPSLFLPTKIGPRLRRQEFVGGALGANNPTRELLNEAITIFGRERRVAQIISLGTGMSRVISLKSSDGQADADQIVQYLGTDCEAVAKELSTRLFSVDAYLRLNVDRGMEDIRMIDWTILGTIESHTSAYVENTAVIEAIEASQRCLQSRIGSISLSQLNHTSSIKISAKEAPAVSSHFVARKMPWETMVKHLVNSSYSHQKIFPITGMGGCGKTQMVSYFLREFQSLYKHIVYVDASSAASIQTDLQTWARSLGDGHERDTWEDAIRTLAINFQNEHHILVFDNADDPNLNLVPFITKSRHVTILITSRNHSLGNMSTTQHLELAEMEDSEALLTLMHAARRQSPLPAEESSDARTLAAELGCLAVALVQAGTYCAELSSTIKGDFHPYTFTQYLLIFRAHRSELMKRAETAALDNYQRGAYTTIDLSYRIVPPTSREFLHFVSFFHHTDIPLAALAAAAEEEFEDANEVLTRPEHHESIRSALFAMLCDEGKWNQLKVQETIRVLRSFSLIMTTSVDDGLFLQLHPLVQAWSRDMEGLDSRHYEGMVFQVFSSCYGENNHRIHQQLLRHIIDKFPYLRSLHANDQVAMGRILCQQGDSRNAALAFETALEAVKIAGNKDTTTLIPSLLADAYQSAGRWREAEKLWLEVLKKDRRTFGPDHQNTIITGANLANTYRSQGFYKKAEKLEADVLKKLRISLGEEHPYTLTAAANLSKTYRSLGRYKEAEELRIDVLERRRRILGTDHPDTIMAAGDLASVYYSNGSTEKCEELSVEVLEQQRRILGVEHPRALTAADNLAVVYIRQGRWTDAVCLLEPVVQSSLKVLGQLHPSAQRRIRRLADTYERLGQWQDADTMSTLLVAKS